MLDSWLFLLWINCLFIKKYFKVHNSTASNLTVCLRISCNISTWNVSISLLQFLSPISKPQNDWPITQLIVFLILIQGPGCRKNYQIHLKSQSGPINVLLVNKDPEADKPVVMQVPPPASLVMESQNVNPSTSAATTAVDTKGGRGKVKVKNIMSEKKSAFIHCKAGLKVLYIYTGPQKLFLGQVSNASS